MLIYGSKLIACPILSLHVGGAVAFVKDFIIDPNNLKIIAFYVEGPLVGRQPANILDAKDVREYSKLGMVIDSLDSLVEPGEVIKISQVIDLNFTLTGLKVETKKGTKLGKVKDFTLNPDNFEIQQLVVERPRLKAFLDPELLIAKKEIVEITDYKIIIKDEENVLKQRAEKEDFVPNFVNPFREHSYAPAEVEKDEQD